MPLKTIFNAAERKTKARLQEICEKHGVSVYPKMRVAEVFPIERSGISDDDYRYALQAHFDFVVVDHADLPLFAVEFDGPSHELAAQRVRDQRKNRLCDRFDLPLLRINSRYIDEQFRGMDLLTWFTDVWFSRAAFFQAQQSGSVPMDEIFDPSFIVYSGESQAFPFSISRDALLRIQALSKAGAITDFAPSHIVATDAPENYRALLWLKINTDNWVLVRTGMRNQRFPVVVTDIVVELGTLDLAEALQETLNGTRPPMNGARLDHEIKAFRTNYRFMSGAACSK